MPKIEPRLTQILRHGGVVVPADDLREAVTQLDALRIQAAAATRDAADRQAGIDRLRALCDEADRVGANVTTAQVRALIAGDL